eukprot:387487_1
MSCFQTNDKEHETLVDQRIGDQLQMQCTDQSKVKKILLCSSQEAIAHQVMFSLPFAETDSYLQMKHNLHPNVRNIMEFDYHNTNLKCKAFYITVDGKQHGVMRRWIRHLDSMNVIIWIVDLSTFNEYIYDDTNDAEEKYDAKKVYGNT